MEAFYWPQILSKNPVSKNEPFSVLRLSFHLRSFIRPF